MRTMKSFNEANVTTAADLAKEFESIFKSYFRDSMILSTVKTNLGKSILVQFSLGDGQKEYRNGIVHNDPMHTQIHVWLDGAVDEQMNITGPLNMERSLGKGIRIIGSQFLEIKVPFRKATGDPNRLLKTFDVYVSRLVQAVKDNIQVIQEDNPQMDVASKI